MKKSIHYAGLEIKPCTKMQKLIPVVGTDIELPVTIINGKEDGKRIVVISGVHSGEYPGIECAIELAQEMKPDDVSGSIVFIHPCNPTGFKSQVSYIVPEDGKNMSESFPGKSNGTASEKICHTITSNFINDDCDMVMDLHGGDLHEHLSTFVFASENGEENIRELVLEVSNYMNVNYIVMAGFGVTEYAANKGIPAFVLERGGRGIWSKEEVDLYKKDVINVFKFFGVVEGEAKYYGPKPYVFKKCDMMYAPISGCWYPFVELEDQFEKGQRLGEIRDFHGKVLHTVYAEYDGVVHSYWSALSVQKGQLMVGYGA